MKSLVNRISPRNHKLLLNRTYDDWKVISKITGLIDRFLASHGYEKFDNLANPSRKYPGYEDNLIDLIQEMSSQGYGDLTYTGSFGRRIDVELIPHFEEGRNHLVQVCAWWRLIPFENRFVYALKLIDSPWHESDVSRPEQKKSESW